jgi:outer membrane receptor protein involved in Fe transport
LLFVCLAVVHHPVPSQEKPGGRISGKVVDRETGEAVVGVNIIVEGTTRGTATDIEGKYLITNLSPGVYTLLFSALSYAKMKITDIRVSEGSHHTIDVALTPEAVQVEEVVVEAKAYLSYESALLARRKQAAMISDGVSAEQMKRTPDATSGDALKRLTGISIVDNKFVFVRGVTDRYNQAMLNGTTLASLDAEKKSFSFDMVPANLLENTVVIKSATPDLPGDFTGGLVQMNTLDFPDQLVLRVSVASAYNSLTTGREIFGSKGGTTDWLGIDDGSRQFRDDGSNGIALARSLPNNWAPRAFKAPTNNSFSLAYGGAMERVGAETGQLGFITSASYRSSFQHHDKIINDVAMGRYNSGREDKYSVLLGALANVSYKLDANKVSFKNSYTRSADDQVNMFRSEDLNTNLENMYTVVNWNQRALYSGQLMGEHAFAALGGLSMDWRASLSTSKREEPDRKEVAYYRLLGNTSDPFEAATNKRSWSHFHDRNSTAGIDVTLPVGALKIKSGFNVESRKADYRIRYFNVQADYMGGASSDLTTLPLDRIYDPSHFGPGKFLFQESSRASDSYRASQNLSAGYIMVDAPFRILQEKFRLVGGARLERVTQSLSVPTTLDPGGPVETSELKNSDLLPSANLTYAMNDFTNLRVAYSHSVNRPEFRELAPTLFFDFVKYEIVGGNPNLKRSVAKNYDVRLEVFPDIGELLAVSYFRKEIIDAIEQQLIQTTVRTRSWFNSPKAVNWGWEFEVRKSLSFLGGYFKHFSITGNYTRIFSKVEFTETTGNSERTITRLAYRPMQGQSPYMVNVSLLFVEPTLKTSVNVLYNESGRRLDAVGFLASDIYEEPRGVLDLSISQPLWSGFEVKLTARNITNKEKMLTRDRTLYEQTAMGTTYSLQLSQSF